MLVVLSMDGFRWDYPDMCDTPTLDSIRDAGVKAESMKASFPTKTFPNHYAIATGLYPDHHGIILNSFFADDLQRPYSLTDREAVADEAFYSGEPLWITAEKQGVRSATLFWVGSEAPVQGRRPSYWKPYDHDMPFEDRVDTLVKWLSYDEERRPSLVFWYLHQPDSKGHRYGPESDSTRATIAKLDELLGHFFHRMRQLPIFDSMNFVITSDHGMTEVSDDKFILLDRYIDTSWITLADGWNPNFNIKVKPGFLEKTFKALDSVPQLDVWKHGSLPERLHYGNNPRTHDIILVARPGWSVGWSWDIGRSKGAHGYDNNFKDMHAIFYAAGPVFRKGYTQPVFENVDIYPLITEIMNLKPAAVDGSPDAVIGMLDR